MVYLLIKKEWGNKNCLLYMKSEKKITSKVSILDGHPSFESMCPNTLPHATVTRKRDRLFHCNG